MSNKTYVWDLLVRLFHWTLVVAFIVSYATGDEESAIHIWSGYLILALLVIRLVWGFVGSRYARFADFLYSPGKALGYFSDLITNARVKRYLGHSPAGGWMVFALLISLSLTVFSGLKLEAAEGRGLLAQGADVTMAANSGFIINTASADDDDDNRGTHGGDGEDAWEEVHEFFANFTVLLIALHIGGVLLSSYRHREALIKAMFTGYK